MGRLIEPDFLNRARFALVKVAATLATANAAGTALGDLARKIIKGTDPYLLPFLTLYLTQTTLLAAAADDNAFTNADLESIFTTTFSFFL